MKDEKKPRVRIGVPVPGNWKIFFPTQMWCITNSARKGIVCDFIPSSRVEKARNITARDSLDDKKATHVLLMDADTNPPGDAIDRLLAHDKDIVGGVTPIWRPDCGCAWNTMPYDLSIPNDCVFKPITYFYLPKKLFRAHYIGGPCVLVKRKVFEALEYPFFDACATPGNDNRRGDLSFNVKAKNAGFEIWCDPTIQCQHQHDVELKSVFDSMAEQAREYFEGMNNGND